MLLLQEEAASAVKAEPEGQAALLGQVIAALQDLLWGIQQVSACCCILCLVQAACF